MPRGRPAKSWSSWCREHFHEKEKRDGWRRNFKQNGASLLRQNRHDDNDENPIRLYEAINKTFEEKHLEFLLTNK